MKKFLCYVFVALILLPSLIALGEEVPGVQVIGMPAPEAAVGSLDDMLLEVPVEIEDWVTVTPVSFEYEDVLLRFDSNYWHQESNSGPEAEYAMLRADIANLTTSALDFIKKSTVKIVYDDKYQYEGWIRQYNYGESDGENRVVHQDKQFPIEPMYIGHYVFGCTLPNLVVTGKAPLRMEVTLNEKHTFIFHIRK